MAPDLHHTLFLTCPLRVFKRITQKLPILHGHCTCMYWTTVCWRHSFCGLQLHERSDWRAMDPDSCQSHSWIPHCVCMLQTRAYIAICLGNNMHDDKTLVMYDCTTPQMRALLPTMHHFVRTKSHRDFRAAAVHSIYLHITVSKLMSALYFLISLSEYACAGTLQRATKQQNNNKKLWLKCSVKFNYKSRAGPVKSIETRQGWKHKKTILLHRNCTKVSLEDYSTSVTI